jgi:putative FmdB family regulatory protein
MPTYVYRCENCGHRFDAWQHMTDEPLTVCPECQGPIHRIVFANGVVFKGGGFYSTDHRPAKAASDTSASSESKTDTKTESAATETKSSETKSSDTKAAPAEAKA